MEQGCQHYEVKDLINVKELIDELKQGKELAKQLQIHLNVPSSTHETRELLAHKIIVSYNKVLAMLNDSITHTTNTTTHGDQQLVAGGTEAIVTHESARSFSGSPHSEDSDRDFKDPDGKLHASRKRKAMPRWTKQVKIYPGMGIEGTLDDRYSWRKYGQKDILGAKYPRGYYRCSHRHVQGCLATKQVQRSDNDSTIVEITYRGRHTCADESSNFTPPPSERSEPPANVATNNHDHQVQLNQPQNSQEVLLSFKTGLKVITEDLDSHEQNHIPTNSFYFPSNNISTNSENYSLPQQYILGYNNFTANIASPSFVSPTTSGSNYNLSVSPSNMSSFGGNFHNLHASDNELAEIISAATSATNSPTVGVNYQFGELEFNSSFTFDNPGFFS